MIEVASGGPIELGCSVHGEWVGFSVFSRHATGLRLLLFEDARSPRPVETIRLDPVRSRTGDIWSVRIKGIAPDQLYAYRAEGPHDPDEGMFFDPDLLLLDPYARAVTDGSAWGDGHPLPGSVPPGSLGRAERDALWSAMPKCVVVDSQFDWRGDRPLNRPLRDTVIYELHVRGFTRDPTSGVTRPGSYAGLVEKIPYLWDLGVTAVELMPVQEFDALENPNVDPLTGERLVNYWGYSPIAFFAPEGRYSHLGTGGQQVDAFKSMVRAFHEAGIEVILDVVFNHTAEGNELGPTLSFRGLDNRIYYMLGDGGARYLNLTGCGNTVNCNHPVVRGLIRDCLRYWVVEMHVDGFRFDLASVLGRAPDGRLLENPPLVELITEDPVLRSTKLIAEAWDAAGAYQVGSFPGARWSEWNGRYRDDVRRFWRGDRDMLGAFATRIAGSSDLYQAAGRQPQHSVNFVTCHDGFTLADLVSYERRHNEANGEDNRDGSPHDHSANHGYEGPTEDPEILAVRGRQVRNLLLSLIMSQGVPMLLAGDEMGRTQGGNNNAYCHDDGTNWIDWGRVDSKAGLVRFVRELLALRQRHACLRRETFLRGGVDVTWIGTDGSEPQWNDPRASALGCVLHARDPGEDPLALLFNASGRAVRFQLPRPPGGGTWSRAVDTGLLPPDDARPQGDEEALDDPLEYRIGARASAVLIGRRM